MVEPLRLAAALHERYADDIITLDFGNPNYFSPLQAKKVINYAESDDDEDAFDPAGISAKK